MEALACLVVCPRTWYGMIGGDCLVKALWTRRSTFVNDPVDLATSYWYSHMYTQYCYGVADSMILLNTVFGAHK